MNVIKLLLRDSEKMFTIRNRFLLLMCGLTAFVSTVCLAFGAWLLLIQLNNSSYKILNSAKENLITSIDFQFLKIASDSKIIANFSQFISKIEARQSLAVLKIATNFKEELGLSEIHSYDNDGNPISLGENGNQQYINFFSEKNNKTLQDNFRLALEGNTSSTIFAGKSLKIMNFSPIYAENKKICGILSTSFILDNNYLESIARGNSVNITILTKQNLLSSSISDKTEVSLITQEFNRIYTQGNSVDFGFNWFAKNSYFLVFKIKPTLVNEPVYAVLSISNAENEYIFQTSKVFIILLGIGIFILAIILSTLGAAGITKGLKKLEKNAGMLSAGNLDTKINATGNDEVAKLARSFEAMRHSMKDLIMNLKETNLSYQRFVPKEFIDILSKDDIRKVTLGNYLEQEMTILFSDIRGYTHIAEKLTPQENFEFINEYLKLIAPIIKKHGGFIDKYIGDGLMALFPNQATKALQAALEILEQLKQEHTENAYSLFAELKIGIGLNTGKVVIGIVGEENRLDATVIGDAVNTAARIESLTRELNTDLLLAASTYNALTDEEKKRMNFAGEFTLKGKQEKVGIYKTTQS